MAQQIIGSAPHPWIPRGLGRSYGDSALAPHLLSTQGLNGLLDFDPETGILHCEAGVPLRDILHVFVPRGFFLPVTPGTQWVSVGGCIASDVHGKNHHAQGTFSTFVTELELLLGDGQMVMCSPQTHSELFRATAGGMGLTGLILTAKIQLQRIQSAYLNTQIFKTRNLQQTLSLFEAHQGATYSVAWIDALATGARLGRGHVIIGEHASEGGLALGSAVSCLNLPVDAPSFCLSSGSIRAFNALYYHRISGPSIKRCQHFEPFFYPLDRVRNWNRGYGKSGFLQHQWVIPKAAGLSAVEQLFKKIAQSGQGSFLAVLKLFGPQNENYLSFPMEGYSLALDFKIKPGIFEFLEKLDENILDFGGRLYLTKDARMTEATFKASYPEWEAFQAVRARYQALGKFSSLQSQRLGLS